MAIRSISIGSLINAYAYDDAVYPDGLSTDGAIKTSKTPASATDVIRQADVGGGGIAAPSDVQYIVVALDGDLSQERVLAVGDNLTKVDGGANGNITLDTIQGIKVTNSPTFLGLFLTVLNAALIGDEIVSHEDDMVFV